ncbi:hypothetical protein QA584_20160 [Anaerocolumna sp. AGMB13025]|uniref:hypothetical protein n=1 Tax=Anaerocolumna sp. AGMB13025 TaxID=3039116 RepID=UPI00241CAD35|nr:hypothetical protein [Anaerocolumna sp. AGMB13025]WFR55914.1 hypothetical protein QA584_20160 [Anaerocolumna sp. AGMB13025]
MKKLFFVYIMLSVLVIASCSNKETNETKQDVVNHNYIFKGESDMWVAEYKVVGTETFTEKDGLLDVETESDNELTVTYKGELANLSSVKHMEISYESSTNSGKMVNDYDKDESITSNTFIMKSGGKNCAIPNENNIIKVIINIDGVEHTLELKNK